MRHTSNTSAGAAQAVQPLPLFRPEVLVAQQAQWMGGIRIARPLSFSLVTSVALVLAAALIAFACWGEVTRKATVHGVLLPVGGLLNITAPQAGVIAESLVREGDTVQAGQPLLRLRSERITAAGDAALLTAQALAARRTSLEAERRLATQHLQQRLDALAQRQQSLQAEQRQAQAELDTHRLRLQLAHKSLERQQQLAGSGFVATAQVQQKQEELLDLQLRERSAERNLQALARELQAVQADRQAQQHQTRTALAQLDRGLAALGQEAAEADSRNGLTVTAPQAGMVSAVTLGAGQAVQAGQTLMSLVPSQAGPGRASGEHDESPSILQAQLYAPSRTAGFVRPGQVVWIRFSAFPHQKFGMARGVVLSVSQSPIAPRDLPVGLAQSSGIQSLAGEAMFRIDARLDSQGVSTYGSVTALKAGALLDADVQLDERTVLEWIFEPAIAVSGRK